MSALAASTLRILHRKTVFPSSGMLFFTSSSYTQGLSRSTGTSSTAPRSMAMGASIFFEERPGLLPR